MSQADNDVEQRYRRYQDLQRYVDWTDTDARFVHAAAGLVERCFDALIDDFYDEISRHADAHRVITGGAEQIARLKHTLRTWLTELFSGQYDRHYVDRRWRVGSRHVEIGLNQVYTNVALSRLRIGLVSALQSAWRGTDGDLLATLQALHKLLDLDLVIIEDAYQSAYLERQQVTQQLQLLDTAVRDVKEGILITDGELDLPGPRIVFVNEALTQITGYAAEDLIGRTPRVFQCPRSDRGVLRELKEHLRQGLPFNAEIINRRKDGSEYIADLHVSPVFGPCGKVRNFVATQRDITARKLAEERIMQAHRLAAIGEMVTGLAHESRNALQRSMACLETLATEVEDRPDALDLVKRVQRAQNHLQHLYEEVRGYAVPLNLRRESTQVAEVWREAWLQLEQLRTGRDVVLREEIEGVDLVLEIDAFAIGQVFRNIFENSIAACADPCEIVVGCMPVRLDGRRALQISVLDNGPGLTREQAQRIFEPFYTTKTKGTGLGMAIVKRIVEAHGGRIAAASEVGHGAQILVTLPRQSVK